MSEQDFKLLQEDLESLRSDPDATLHYDVMSDALVWSDELLRTRRAREIWCMRPIFRYRTGLLLGLELLEFSESWTLARSIFPRWIGFAQERCERSVPLELMYRNLKRK